MNILASYNWIKKYLDTDLSPKEFAEKMTAAGNSVEHMDNLRERFANIVVGEIISVKKHPQADRLSLFNLFIFSKTIKVVCGGTNLAHGQKVAVALPGAMVRWHGAGEPVVLQEAEVRGVKSEGMICAAAELGLEKIPQGEKEIWDLSALPKAAAGKPLAEALVFYDFIFFI